MSDYDEKTLRPMLDAYCAVVNAGLDERREKITSKYPGKEYQVVIGLMARQAELSIQLAGNVGIWYGSIPPLVIRCMTDCFITLSWILKDVEKHAQIYLKYSHDKAKFMFSSYDKTMGKMAQELEGVSALEVEEISQKLKNAPNISQVRNLVQQIFSAWDIKDDVRSKDFPKVKDMAGCVGKNSLLYDCCFFPMSLVMHNNWVEVERILTKSRENPFACKVDETNAVYLGGSTFLISMAYNSVDEKLKLECNSNMPIKYWEEHFPDKCLANQNQYFENILNNDKAE